MNTKSLKNILMIATIPLLLAGCSGKEAPVEAGAAPKALPDTLKIRRISKTYVITGIGIRNDNSKKFAIINGAVVTPGMEIDPGVVLSEIHPTYAIIVHGNSEHLLRPEDIQNELDAKKD